LFSNIKFKLYNQYSYYLIINNELPPLPPSGPIDAAYFYF